jgi:AraC-like DNA-binding protein
VGFNIDFAQLTPQVGLSRVVSRVGMSPAHLKLLVQVLGANLAQYEQQYGIVQVTPQMMAEHAKPHQPLGFHPEAPDQPAQG